MNYERIYYSIEDDNGEKVLHYITSMSENGEMPPDDWTSEEYEAQSETSVDIIDYTWLYVKVSDLQWLSLVALCDRLGYEEEMVKQYVDRVIAHKADEWIAEQDDCKELDIRKVNEDTPCGFYWSLGYWMMKE